MSTNDILVRRAAEAARLEELRRLEAEQAERERQRLGFAHQAVSDLDQRFRELITQRDEAARRLPDLSLQEPPWPSLSASASQSAAEVERYAGELQALVGKFDRQLNAAIQDAEAVLADRLARAQAWRDATALEQAVQVCRQHLADASQALQEKVPAMQAIGRPEADAPLASLQRYVAALQAQVAAIQQQTAACRRRLETRRLGQSLAGSQVATSPGAESALANHAAQQRAKARQALQATLAQALAQSGLNLADLPAGSQVLLNATLDAAEANATQRERIQRLVARERVLHQHAAQALQMMQLAPDLVHAHPKRAQRWNTLVQQLHAVCAGWAPLSPHHGLEYEQIKADAQRDLDRRYVQTDFVNALREQDFNALSDEEGRLVIEDLRHLGVWMEETQALEVTEGERGGIATVLELKTDAPLAESGKDEQVIASVCERLQAASHSSAKVQSEHEVLDRKKKISRGRRPAKLKSFNAQA